MVKDGQRQTLTYCQEIEVQKNPSVVEASVTVNGRQHDSQEFNVTVPEMFNVLHSYSVSPVWTGNTPPKCVVVVFFSVKTETLNLLINFTIMLTKHR